MKKIDIKIDIEESRQKENEFYETKGRETRRLERRKTEMREGSEWRRKLKQREEKWKVWIEGKEER